MKLFKLTKTYYVEMSEDDFDYGLPVEDCVYNKWACTEACPDEIDVEEVEQ